MTNQEFNKIFRRRTLDFSIRVFHFIETLPELKSTRVISYQLGKSASSVGANFRAFCRGRSYKEKYAKICIVVEEADEVEFWLLNLKELGFGNRTELEYLMNEAVELIKITSKIKANINKL